MGVDRGTTYVYQTAGGGCAVLAHFARPNRTPRIEFDQEAAHEGHSARSNRKIGGGVANRLLDAGLDVTAIARTAGKLVHRSRNSIMFGRRSVPA
ncbi:MAG: hypothetical protein ABJA82_17550, partial [Myxococcales bacterium]